MSTDLGLTYTTLTPRQQVTYTPYALFASKAASATSVTGNVQASQITGFMNPQLLGPGTINQALNFSPASGAPFSVGGTTKVTNLNSDMLDGLDSAAFLQRSGGSMLNTTKVTNFNSDLLDGLDSTAFLQLSGGTMTGPLGIQSPAALNFGNIPRQMINLYNAEYAIGIQGDTVYQRTGNDFSWFKGGVHSNTRNSPGSGGKEMMRLDNNSTLWLNPNNSFAPRGRILFGDLNSSNLLPYASIAEAADDDDMLEITGQAVRIRSNNSTPPQINFGAITGQLIELFNNGSDTYGIGVQSGTQYFRTGDHFAWFKDGIHDDAAFNAGSGGTTLMRLNSTGRLEFPSIGNIVNSVGNFGVGLSLRSDLIYFKNQADATMGVINNVGDLNLTGALSTTVLTIRGGADVAEPFDMTGPDEMEPGSVVIIDEENPGKLRLSTEDHDTRVAGIISGAGGVKPGLRLHQDGVIEGDHHVALSGRVYVKADTSGGAIKPGDLLTTSGKAGHAMKVTDSTKSQGAILGKAMTQLDESSGLVLVLVTLQ